MALRNLAHMGRQDMIIEFARVNEAVQQKLHQYQDENKKDVSFDVFKKIVTEGIPYKYRDLPEEERGALMDDDIPVEEFFPVAELPDMPVSVMVAEEDEMNLENMKKSNPRLNSLIEALGLDLADREWPMAVTKLEEVMCWIRILLAMINERGILVE